MKDKFTLKAQTAIRLIREVKNDEEIIKDNKKRLKKACVWMIVGIIITVVAFVVLYLKDEIEITLFDDEAINDNAKMLLAVMLLVVGWSASARASMVVLRNNSINRKLRNSLAGDPNYYNVETFDFSAVNYAAKIKRYNLFFIIISSCLLLSFCSAVYIPYVTVLGQKVSIHDCFNDYKNIGLAGASFDEIKISEYNIIDAYAKNIFGKRYDAIGILLSAIVVKAVQLLIVIFVAITIGLIIYQFFIKEVKEEREIPVNVTIGNYKYSLIIVSLSDAGFIISFPLLWISMYVYLKKNSGGLDLGELYSVSPMMLILPLSLILLAVILNQILVCILMKDKEMQCALLYSRLYRFLGSVNCIT